MSVRYDTAESHSYAQHSITMHDAASFDSIICHMDSILNMIIQTGATQICETGAHENGFPYSRNTFSAKKTLFLLKRLGGGGLEVQK